MQIFFVGVINAMAQGERLHLSYERMALLVGSAPAFVGAAAKEPKILKRIQTISYSFDFGAQQLKELGSLEYIKDRSPAAGSDLATSRIPVVSQPTVNLQFEYLFLDTKNEENIGFGINENSIFKNSPLYNKPNYDTHAEVLGDVDFVLVADNESRRSDVFGGQVYRLKTDPNVIKTSDQWAALDEAGRALYEASTDLTGFDVIGFGNCYLGQYSINMAMGSPVQCGVSYACSNLKFDTKATGVDIKFPSVDKNGTNSATTITFPDLTEAFSSNEISALRPGDVKVTLTNNSTEGFHVIDLESEQISIQSIEISTPIPRQNINAFGSDYMRNRKIQFPVLGTLSMSLHVQKFANKGQIKEIFSGDVDYDVDITLYGRDSGGAQVEKASLRVSNAKLNSESHSISIGGFMTVSSSFAFEVTPEAGFSISPPS